ncbi:hypothetical protein DENSPDRAFT_841929 [Dentipellis sp. KUC8613]|nr:hypothetical protein DENSPDRAFT_841929 [Dentipellis sp. KUC8613]
MQATIDVLEALDQSVQAGWRHGDVSVKTIRIYGGRGLLIDWDASRALKSTDTNLRNGARVKDLTGTWQFMSLRRLRDPTWRHEAVDDRESVFWVLLWLALKYGVHSLALDTLGSHLRRVFDDCILMDGHYTGGDGKDLLLDKRNLDEYLPTTFSPDGLQNTLKKLHRIFRTPPTKHYIDGYPEDMAELTMEVYEMISRIMHGQRTVPSSVSFLLLALGDRFSCSIHQNFGTGLPDSTGQDDADRPFSDSTVVASHATPEERA